jgi:small subunit ribosomal protein S14
MKYLKIKDRSIRNLNSKLELKKKLLKFLFINLQNKLICFNTFNIKFLKYYKRIKTSKVSIKNRCILTNRSKGVNRTYSLSRLKLREYLQFGIFPGFKKSVW